jgi:hypothetical protein
LVLIPLGRCVGLKKSTRIQEKIFWKQDAIPYGAVVTSADYVDKLAETLDNSAATQTPRVLRPLLKTVTYLLY